MSIQEPLLMMVPNQEEGQNDDILSYRTNVGSYFRNADPSIPVFADNAKSQKTTDESAAYFILGGNKYQYNEDSQSNEYGELITLIKIEDGHAVVTDSTYLGPLNTPLISNGTYFKHPGGLLTDREGQRYYFENDTRIRIEDIDYTDRATNAGVYKNYICIFVNWQYQSQYSIFKITSSGYTKIFTETIEGTENKFALTSFTDRGVLWYARTHEPSNYNSTYDLCYKVFDETTESFGPEVLVSSDFQRFNQLFVNSIDGKLYVEGRTDSPTLDIFEETPIGENYSVSFAERFTDYENLFRCDPNSISRNYLILNSSMEYAFRSIFNTVIIFKKQDESWSLWKEIEIEETEGFEFNSFFSNLTLLENRNILLISGIGNNTIFALDLETVGLNVT